MEHREVMYAYSSSSCTFVGMRHQPCRFRTALCPDRCGHATNVFTFQLDNLAVTKNEESRNAKWVEPLKVGSEHAVGEADLGEASKTVAQLLQPGDKVQLEWSHDYVTVAGSSGPDRPVSHLVKLK